MQQRIKIKLLLEYWQQETGRELVMKIARLTSEHYTIVPESLKVDEPGGVLNLPGEHFGEMAINLTFEVEGEFNIKTWPGVDGAWIDGWNHPLLDDIQEFVRIKEQRVLEYDDGVF